VNTKYKCEKIVQRLLNQKNIEVYLPLQQFSRKRGRSIKNVEIPLISCYIFVKINRVDYTKVLETEYVVGYVRFAKDLISVPEAEIELLQRIVGENLDILVEKATFYEGDEVEIAAGNLNGIRGKLVSIEGKNRMLVELNHLGYALQISVEKQVIRKV
jgi:transcription antitermination factor NusG